MYKQARWNEPVIFELGRKGEKGLIVPNAEEKIRKMVGNVESRVPEKMRRKKPPELPEISEVEAVRHYLRLSQMTFSPDFGIYPRGCCTMKYNPKINDALARSPLMTDIHPLQDEQTIQGILEVMYKLSRFLTEIFGMDEFTLQPSGGADGELCEALIVRAYHRLNGELEKRTEMLVPYTAHGCNAMSAAVAGFKVVVLYPNEDGCVDVEGLKAAISARTAGIMMTNPTDPLGIFETNVGEIVRIVHEAGGLACCDAANFNALFGKTRVGDMGFDMCHANLHKSFSTPHGGGGPASGPVGVKGELEKFLPIPRVEYDGSNYRLNYDRPYSIGRIRGFYGPVSNALRALAWIMNLGPEGLNEVAEIAALNCNYVIHKLKDTRGWELPFAKGRPRKEQVVFSLKKLFQETGVNAGDLCNRLLDFGMQSPQGRHYPPNIEEPLIIEPTESIDKAELDRFIEAMRKITDEAYTNPKVLLEAPVNTSTSKLDETKAAKPETMTLTWRMYLKRKSK